MWGNRDFKQRKLAQSRGLPQILTPNEMGAQQVLQHADAGLGKAETPQCQDDTTARLDSDVQHQLNQNLLGGVPIRSAENRLRPRWTGAAPRSPNGLGSSHIRACEALLVTRPRALRPGVIAVARGMPRGKLTLACLPGKTRNQRVLSGHTLNLTSVKRASWVWASALRRFGGSGGPFLEDE